jgi:hypothetical protein
VSKWFQFTGSARTETYPTQFVKHKGKQFGTLRLVPLVLSSGIHGWI